MSGSIKPFDR